MRIGSSNFSLLSAAVLAITATLLLAPATAAADGVVFQKPGIQKAGRTSAPGANASSVTFRAASSQQASQPAAAPQEQAAPPVARATSSPATFAAPAQPLATAPRKVAVRTRTSTTIPSFAQPGEDLAGQDLSGGENAVRSRAIAAASIEPLMRAPSLGGDVHQASYGAGYCDCGEATCGICEAGCGIAEPACGLVEPECGVMEADCGLVDPGCGMEPTCGCGEPDCGMVGCGSCVGNPGPDYWCFPVCLPRFKDLRAWAGVHGFKGPRDSPAFGGAGDGNFGFQEGFNIGGRAPLLSLLFPQLSYQLGYQAVQSQLSGLSDGTADDRSQQFVTAGVFRRVPAGVQFGVVMDLLRDDFQMEEDFHQLRYEISLKSKGGHEFGLWGASHTNDATVAGINYEAVDQYCGFYRCHFREGGAIRFWGGATNDSEAIFGGDFVAPLNNRWSLQSNFNYLITDANEGTLGAQEESWNVGFNLVWHYGLTAKKGYTNPHAPLFQTADNGLLFIDQAP